jgi:cellulose synthase-like protein
MASKGILKNSGSSRMPPKPTVPPTVVFGRRTDSGRFISYSRDDLDSEISSVDFHVHIPMTPDNQPMDEDGGKADDQYASGSLFTGGFNSVTRAHVMDKGDAAGGRAGGKGRSTCMVQGCDAKVMRDGRGDAILPCECEFRICLDCFTDAVKAGGGACPGCKEQYKNTDWEDVAGATEVTRALSLRRGPGRTDCKMERGMSLVKQADVNMSAEFDHNRWLFETKGTYGYGNAIWPQDSPDDEGEGDGPGGQPKELLTKPWRPLTRKLRIPAAVISPYRYCLLLLPWRPLFKYI